MTYTICTVQLSDSVNSAVDMSSLFVIAGIKLQFLLAYGVAERERKRERKRERETETEAERETERDSKLAQRFPNFRLTPSSGVYS